MIKKIILSIFLLILFSMAFAFSYYRQTISRPLDESSQDEVLFEIKSGENTREIVKRLSDKKLIRSQNIFLIYAKSLDKNIMPGIYSLSPAMSMETIYTEITTGNTKMVKLTFREGWRSEQYAQELEESGLVTYKEFIEAAKGYEGQLFPDTYYFSEKNTPEEIVKLMLDNYQKRTKGLEISKEDLIIASIVEREAINNEERTLIAGIYKNRIKQGMKLEADPTVKYALDNINLSEDSFSGLEKYEFWVQPVILSKVKAIQSPYNTYYANGLPPTPICNPGIESINGTLNYQKHNYLYFLQKDGKIYPSETSSGHDLYRERVLGAKI